MEERPLLTDAECKTSGEPSPTTPSRILGRVGDPALGPRLIIVAGVHGNEPGGVVASHRLLEILRRPDVHIKGEVVVLVGNHEALRQRVRFVQEDLNRLWTRERVSRSRQAPSPPSGIEDREQWGLLRVLDTLFEDPGPQVVMDLHSTSGPGSPFACISDTLKSRELALGLPVPLLLGIEESIRGTLLDHMEREGRTMLLVEGGQHDDPHTADHLLSLLWLVLKQLAMIADPFPYDESLRLGKSRLEAATAGLPAVLEVSYRQEVQPTDQFRMNPGHGNFERVQSGQPLARSVLGPIHAPGSGYLVMPLYQPQGSDGFFIARPIRPAWLRLSTWVRFMRVDRILPQLPGVQPDPALPLRLEVDPTIARWGTVPLFHLAGFRRLPDRDGKLRFTRRIEP